MMKNKNPKQIARRLNIQLGVAVALTVVGVVMLMYSLAIPVNMNVEPAIDPTVLTGFGEILTFVAAVLGVDYHYRFKNYVDKQLEEDEEQDKMEEKNEKM